MQLRINIDKNEQEKLKRDMMIQLAAQMLFRLTNNKDQMKINIDNYIRGEFFQSEAVQSMVDDNGQLKGQLGLDKTIRNNLQKILDTVIQNIKIDGPNRKIFSKSIKIYYYWKILKSGYNDLTSLPEASYVSDQLAHWSGTKIPWLEWLLKGCPGVQGYIVGKLSTQQQQYHSRSGINLMFKALGHTWNITADPSMVGGLNENDNFLIKIFDGISEIIAQEVERVLNA
jgi:hypothetical protein